MGVVWIIGLIDIEQLVHKLLGLVGIFDGRGKHVEMSFSTDVKMVVTMICINKPG